MYLCRSKQRGLGLKVIFTHCTISPAEGWVSTHCRQKSGEMGWDGMRGACWLMELPLEVLHTLWLEVMVHACKPSYLGSESRSFEVQGQPRQKCETLSENTTSKSKGLGEWLK
jgi:hypothetical protein